MRAIFGLVLILGMGLAGFAVYMVKGHFSNQDAALARERARSRAAIVTVDVYAPSRAVTYGELLTAEDVRVIKYAKEYLPEGVFKTEEELFPEGLDVPRVVVRPMEVNEPILAVKVSAPGASRGLTALLDRGMRAFTINGSISTGNSGPLRPDDRIDVYWNGNSRGKEVTQLIRTSVEIIAVGESNNRRGTQGVTVQVTPEDVAMLAQAQSTGNLLLSLVGTGDDTQVGPIIVDQRELLGIPDDVVVEREAPAPVAKKCYVTQTRGTDRVRVEIDCPSE